MSKITRQDTNGVKPLLGTGELGYDNYPAGGDAGRVWVGTGTENIGLAKKTEVITVDGKADAHIARVDNPHTVTKAQVGLGAVDNTSDANKPISTATQTALNTKQGVLVSGTNIKTVEGQSLVGSGNIDLTKSDVGLNNVDNTADSTKNVLSATKWTTSRNITIGNSTKSVDGAGNVAWTLAEIGAIGPDSAALTGVPTAPTAAVNTNTTQLATTAFVNAEIANDAVPRVASTDNAVVRFDGVTGAVQNSGVFINDIDVYDAANFGLSISSRAGGKNSIYSYLDASTLEFYSGVTQKTGIVMNGQSAVGGSKITFRAGGKESGAIDNTGNLLLTSGTGALGYGAGAGGTVTQLTSKSTAVTLNKPSGRIVMHNAALAAGESVNFGVYNSLVTTTDIVNLSSFYNTVDPRLYRIEVGYVATGFFNIKITNTSAGSLSHALLVSFSIIKGAIA